MASEKATAIVLRVVDFSESSVVTTLFSREFGKVRALAKGGRRPKGPFESALDLLAMVRIVFLHKPSDTLDLLTEAKLLRRFRPANRDLGGLYAAYYVAELLNELTDDYDSHPELFDAADQTLSELSASGPVAELILRFELTALRLLGHQPSLDRCVQCGNPVSEQRRIAFGQLAGGVLCEDCRAGHGQVVSVSSAVIEALRTFSNPDNEQWRNEPLARNVRGELRAIVNHYLYSLLGRKLRVHEYLGTYCT